MDTMYASALWLSKRRTVCRSSSPGSYPDRRECRLLAKESSESLTLGERLTMGVLGFL